ncbi:hypothetical protein EON77_14120 [bacterium]|nr:MAG: hypothetical protein EON77_14120 [bacterium]
MKKALEAAKASGLIDSPDPVPSSLVKKLKLPNGESLSPGMKELLAFDVSFVGIDYDDEEAEIETASLDELVEEHFGEEAVAAFDEAYELLSDDCIALGGDFAFPSCLYIGNADDAGEYPVISLSYEDGVAKIGGFVPFDVFIAQALGGLERGKQIGDVPPEYAALPAALAKSNGDERIVFTPVAGEGGDADDDEEEDEDEDDEDDKSDAEPS